MLQTAVLMYLVGCADHTVATRSFCSVPPSIPKPVDETPPPPPKTTPVGKVMEISGYTSSEAETDSNPCEGARSIDICELRKRGVQTCSSNSFPLKTLIEVEGLGTCMILDRMDVRYTNNVDWHFGQGKEAVEEANAWGRKRRKVTKID